MKKAIRSLISICLIFYTSTTFTQEIKPLKYLSQEFNQKMEEESTEINIIKDEYLTNLNATIITNLEEYHIPLKFNISNNSQVDYNVKIEALISSINNSLNVLNRDKYNVEIDNITHFSEKAEVSGINLCLMKGDQETQTSPITYIDYNTLLDNSNDLSFIDVNYNGIQVFESRNIINIYILPLNYDLIGFASQPWVNSDKRFIVYNKSLFDEGGEMVVSHLIHLIGTYLGLSELWSETGYCVDDYVDDTPIHNAPNYEVYKSRHYSSCEGFPLAMTMNFMDNAYNSFMFTSGQVKRLNALLNENGPLHDLSNNIYSCIEVRHSKVDDELPKFKVYPNPSNELIFIDGKNIGQNKAFYYKLSTLDNKTLKHVKIIPDQRNIEFSISLSDISAGTYILSFESENFIIQNKIIVIK